MYLVHRKEVSANLLGETVESLIASLVAGRGEVLCAERLGTSLFGLAI